MLGRKIQLFKLLGFKVSVDLSWVFLAILVTWSLATGVFPNLYTELSVSVYWAMGFVGAVLFFASIIFHELSHSLVARHYDIQIDGITLFIFGGVAEMTKPPNTPKAEFWMAIAGPIASLLLAGVLLSVHALGVELAAPIPLLGVLQYLGWINGLLAIFNLIPAFPLDGGRVFRAVLWHRSGNIRYATKIAARWGNGLGLAFMFAGAYWFISGNIITGIWWFLIGQFIRIASAASYQQLLMRGALEGVPVRHFMVKNPITVLASINIKTLVDEYFLVSHHRAYPVLEGNHLLGIVTVKNLKEIPPEQWRTISIRDVTCAVSASNTIGVNQQALTALTRMQKNNQSKLLVTETDGSLVGILTLKDMIDAFTLHMSLENYTSILKDSN